MRVRSALYGMLLGVLIPTLRLGQAAVVGRNRQTAVSRHAAEPIASDSTTYLF